MNDFNNSRAKVVDIIVTGVTATDSINNNARDELYIFTDLIASIIQTVPAEAGIFRGTSKGFLNRASYAVTVRASSSQTLNGLTGVPSDIVVFPRAYLEIITTSPNTWISKPVAIFPSYGSTLPAWPYLGQMHFNSVSGRPVWYNGSGWVNADGTPAS